jgi:hypothetical protein
MPVRSGMGGGVGPTGGCGANREESQGGAAEGPPQSLDAIHREDGRLGERGLPATRGEPGQQLGRTRDRDFAGGTGRAGYLSAGRSVTDRFISESSAAAATGVTTAAASTKSGFPSAVRDQSLLPSGPDACQVRAPSLRVHRTLGPALGHGREHRAEEKACQDNILGGQTMSRREVNIH